MKASFFSGKEGRSDFDVAAENEGLKNLFIDDIQDIPEVPAGSVHIPISQTIPSVSLPLNSPLALIMYVLLV
jgi:hypothetical protein